MSGRPAARVRRIIATALACALIAVTVYAVMNRQLLQDRFAAATFDAPTPIAELKHSLQLTEAGARIFLAAQPTLDGSQNFNAQCSQVQEGATGHVLGCYIDGHIHLFDVTDPRVSGIVEVTAAHELLHATWARMRPGDRALLAEKLRKLYDERSQEDPDLATRMAMYEELPEAAFAAELHSVLGSEQADLPDWLEEHYAEWFTDRASIVQTYQAYRSVFQGLKNEASRLQHRMHALRVDIEERKVAYDDAIALYETDLAEFERRVTDREFTNDPKLRESLRSDLKSRRAELNHTLEDLQGDIDQYNDMRAELEELSQLSIELEEQLDSALAPVTTRPSQ
ncbi:hypothetical protein ACXR2T_00745 [Leucobacter sp. HY1910]